MLRKCWVVEPRRLVKILCAMVVTILAATLGPVVRLEAAEYYVSTLGSDQNSGKRDDPLQTIPRASELAKPGDIVYVLPGTYEGGFVTRSNGTAANRITYASAVKWQAKIAPPRISSSDTGWENQGNYVDILDFQVDGTNNSGGQAWFVGVEDASSNSRIIGNWIHHIKAPCNHNGGAGINAYQWKGNLNTSIIGNVVHDIGDVVGGCPWVHGIYHQHSGLIINNLVFRAAGWGIHLWHKPHDITISNNTVFNNKRGGIVIGGEPSEISGYPGDIIVVNNIVYDNPIGVGEEGLTSPNNQYIANMVYGNQVDWKLQNNILPVRSVAADPRFVRYDPDGGGDYRLSDTSPAIDAGVSGYAAATDILGITRPQGSGIDIGAYEFCCR